MWKTLKWSFIANEKQIDFLISPNLKNKAYKAGLSKSQIDLFGINPHITKVSQREQP